MSREYESLVENQETLATWSLGPGPESAVAFPGHHDSHHDSQFADAEEMDVPGIHLTDQPDMEDEYREIRNDMMTEDHGGICRTIIFEAVEEETDDEFVSTSARLMWGAKTNLYRSFLQHMTWSKASGPSSCCHLRATPPCVRDT